MRAFTTVTQIPLMSLFVEMSKQQRRKLKFKKREERRKERERRRQNKKNKESDVELGPLGTFLKSIIVANTFVD